MVGFAKAAPYQIKMTAERGSCNRLKKAFTRKGGGVKFDRNGFKKGKEIKWKTLS